MRKQGSADRDVMRPKTEPVARSVHPGATGQMGMAANFRKESLYGDRGFNAPHDAGKTVHKQGSQGKR